MKRQYGFWTGLWVLFASQIGSGILTNSGPALKATGSYPVLFLLWVVGGLLSLLGAAVLAEVASARPEAGGDYVYVHEAFGPAVGFVYGWAMVLWGFAAPAALIAYTTASFSLTPLLSVVSLPTGLGREQLVVVFAAVLIAMVGLGHSLSYRHSRWLQAGITFFKLAVVALFVAAGWLGRENGQLLNLVGADPQVLSVAGLGSALLLILYAYSGWNSVIYLAGEIENPRMQIPRVILGGCGLVMLVYLVMNVVYALAMPVEVVQQLSGEGASRMAELAIEKLLGPSARDLLGVLVGIGGLASLSAYLLTGARVVFALSERRFGLPGWARTHAKSGLPLAALASLVVFAEAFLFSGTFEELLGYTGYGLGVLSLLVVSPQWVLRKRPGYEPSFRLPFFPWPVASFLVANAVLLVAAAVYAPHEAAVGIGSVALGIPVFWLLRYSGALPAK